MAYKRSDGGLSAARQAVKLLGVSVLSGVVLAGIALPATGALGLTAKGAAAGFDQLPGELKRPPLSQASRILDANGGLIATVYSRDRVSVPLDRISPTMQKAIVAIEDARYWKHGAIDVKGVLRALNTNATQGGVAQGASTLTQQYIKNVFIEEAGDDPDKVAEATQQTLGRKVKELKYAIQVEKELGKRKILENYLNITFFGEQAYGVQAAAQRYFSTDADKLTLDQAALLAGLVQSPTRYDPINDPKAALTRRNTVLSRMADLHDITRAQATAAQARPLGLKPSIPRNGCITAVQGAGFFCDYVRETFLNNPVFGKTREARAKRWTEGGLTIKTTLDPKAQASLQASVTKHVYTTDPVATAVTMVEPGSGKIRAMGQSRPYGFGAHQTQINYSVDRNMGGGLGYQPGSTIKAFTAAAALENGMSATQSYPSPYQMPYPDVTDCSGHRLHDDASVPNENKSEVGPYTMPEALQKSINTYFVSLEADTGLCNVVKMVNNLGMDKRAGGGSFGLGASFTLGANEASPLDMAAAYAAFANGGVYCAPTAIESVTDTSGKSLPVPQESCHRAMSQQTADTINTMLKGVVDDGTGKEAGLKDRDSAGKTGTTDSRYAAWFVGYTPNMSAAVWVGDPAHHVQMYDITIGGVYHQKVYGQDTPAPIWQDAVSGALAGVPAESFRTVNIPTPDKKGGQDAQKPQTPAGDKHDHGRGHNNGKAPGGPDPQQPPFNFPPGIIAGNENGGGLTWP
ncbi:MULTISPECIES: transglycosylase domain-containing protein [Streptomycetaceae]|uniref:Penicillin-binding protein n=1 Tax=Streptantibioticus cattleyicolor (strain ATCC 35852 / DSM 46488 / JCM 4925 / NBRC 14057 / NRRL 8057) TaxID=1003195 RepID=F8K1P8_STREN|nr:MULTISPECIES: transglycosylase domain-containing protein [Streptomycetaceae]AEW95250.1 penicillin-binding protein [Streptantibioticus cattleyicolor NRRL 8057 = DSM 46488]MYS59830.1 penicillin-binding protein [Streptomyces sp. SID5468]CCB75594.1 putative penicillin-binding protein [Streptantibioticus cattleyicolor NRRL 8057 = DSM 46488]